MENTEMENTEMENTEKEQLLKEAKTKGGWVFLNGKHGFVFMGVYYERSKQHLVSR